MRQIDFELEKAEHGMGRPYGAEPLGTIRTVLLQDRCSARGSSLAPSHQASAPRRQGCGKV